MLLFKMIFIFYKYIMLINIGLPTFSLNKYCNSIKNFVFACQVPINLKAFYITYNIKLPY